jgi:hypothetical protein
MSLRYDYHSPEVLFPLRFHRVGNLPLYEPVEGNYRR